MDALDRHDSAATLRWGVLPAVIVADGWVLPEDELLKDELEETRAELEATREELAEFDRGRVALLVVARAARRILQYYEKHDELAPEWSDPIRRALADHRVAELL